MIAINYLTGAAGTGKSTCVRQRQLANGPGWTKTCATTGVAAMNLGTITLHSLLRFFSPADFYDPAKRIRMMRKLDQLQVKVLTIDEASMLDKVMFEGLVNLLDEYGETDLLLCGDFAQLSPVGDRNNPNSGQYCFQSPLWNERVQVEKLTKIWRQDHVQFLQALSLARQGLGPAAARLLKDICEFSPTRQVDYPGICLVATKAEAQSYNTQNLEALPGDYITYQTQRWGLQMPEWRDLPDMVSLKPNCRVRIRANETKQFTYVNGDTGTFIVNDTSDQVLLDRTGATVSVDRVTRFNDVDGSYDGNCQVKVRRFLDEDGSERQQRYIGSVSFKPLEPGYASSVHSAQGLTLDSCQISLSGLTPFQFKRGWGHNLAYVALSRAVSPERLRIHGTWQGLGPKIKIDPRVNSFI